MSPTTKNAPGQRCNSAEGKDRNTYQENQTMNNATPTLAHPTDAQQQPSSGEAWTRRICAAINAERRRQRCSLKLLAALMDVSEYKAAAVCHGAGRVTITELHQASTVLGVSLADLMRNADEAQTVNHFVSKANVTRSVVFGVPVKTLCGDRLVVEPEDGEVADGEAAVCALCSIVYASLEAA